LTSDDAIQISANLQSLCTKSQWYTDSLEKNSQLVETITFFTLVIIINVFNI